ncbi:MAG: hypothetical protein K9N23_07290 [Akkermansiaceae bacterium]|nr:hypothetical protein [Akkermansiaceae bacterium]MCF7731473.1 hypothetical protein [Akkermansiaceae bacterium]
MKSTFPLTITQTATGFDLEWASRAGMRYNLKSTDDLSADLSTWTLVKENIVADPRQGGYELRPGYEGVASSEDGLSWRRAQDEPILSVHQEDCGHGKRAASTNPGWWSTKTGTTCSTTPWATRAAGAA